MLLVLFELCKHVLFFMNGEQKELERVKDPLPLPDLWFS
jgi:hypothetical protein